MSGHEQRYHDRLPPRMGGPEASALCFSAVAASHSAAHRQRECESSGEMEGSQPLSLLLPRYRIKNPPVTLVVISSRFSLPSQSHAKSTVDNDTENGPCMRNLSCPSVPSSPSPLCSHQLPARIRLANPLAFLAFSWWQGTPGSGDTIAIPDGHDAPLLCRLPPWADSLPERVTYSSRPLVLGSRSTLLHILLHACSTIGDDPVVRALAPAAMSNLDF